MYSHAKCLCVASLFLACTVALGQEPTVDLYLNQIKPLLRERCFACHGALKQEAGLRLDTAEAMRSHGILDGDFLYRLTSTDGNVRMPPDGEALTDSQIEVIKHWIDSGAPAPDKEQSEEDPTQHWAFQRIRRPPLPESNERNPIDVLLREKHEELGLLPQGESPRTLLLRRLYLDLIGLPPTAEQLRTEEPLERTIDSLLSSPQYGERWGRHWMDIWRYSEWYGLDEQLRNGQKHLWHWRDWIIQSMNEDKGYDQMIQEMLAGDELAPQDPSTVVATGFLARNYYLFNRTTWLDDTIEHTGKAFLGLTMNCAKCHDHKYDPISHEDYYRFRAVFEPHHVRLDALPGETDFAKDALPRAYDDTLDAATYVHRRGDPSQPIEDKRIQAGPPEFLAAFAEQSTEVELPLEAWAPGSRQYVQADQIESAQRKLEKAQSELEQARRDTAAREEVKLTEPSDYALHDDFKFEKQELWDIVGTGWRYHDGCLSNTDATTDRTCVRAKTTHPRNFELTLCFQTTGGSQWKSTGIRFDSDENGRNSHTVYTSAYVDGPKVQLAHTVAGKDLYPSDAAVSRPIQLNQKYVLNIRVREDLINVSLDDAFLFAYRLPERRIGFIELFAFDSTADFYSIDVQTLASDVVLEQSNMPAVLLDSVAALEVAETKKKLAEVELQALKARIAVDNATLKDSPDASTQVGHLLEQAGQLQLEVQLARAELEVLVTDDAKRAEAVTRRDEAKAALAAGALPQHEPLRGSERALNKLTDNASQYAPIYPRKSTGRRTALAGWITHRDNPLTARVAVNHIWMRHFGTPLVETVFDFGRRAPQPLHQDVLDYLASELIESGWSMKHLHRLILNSKTWQRSSSNLGADEQTLSIDPENHHYWRMNSRRMESQTLRDSLLYLAEKLDPTHGGPSIASAPDVRRRSVYLFHSRDRRDKFLATFDDADVFACYRRTESIVPGQALAMMNSREAMEAATGICSQLDLALSDKEFAEAAFFKILARLPTAKESEACQEFLEQSNDRIRFIHALLNHNDFQVIR